MVHGTPAVAQVQHGAQGAGDVRFGPLHSRLQVHALGQVGGDGAGQGAAGAVGVGIGDAAALEPAARAVLPQQVIGVVQVVAAILACSWSYAEIGQALAKRPGAADHPFYGEWVRGYASENYAATNQALMALMDELAKDATGAQFDRLEEIFVNCSRYELGFWDMAWEMRV